MRKNRSSRALASALLFAVCGPIAALGIAVVPAGGDAPQARVIDAYHQRHGGRHSGRYHGPEGSIRHLSTTTKV